MRILFLIAHLPIPSLSGAGREFELISRLVTNYEIRLCSITESRLTDHNYVSELHKVLFQHRSI